MKYTFNKIRGENAIYKGKKALGVNITNMQI